MNDERPDGRTFDGHDAVPDDWHAAVQSVETDQASGAGDDLTGEPAGPPSDDEVDGDGDGDADQTQRRPPSSGRRVAFAAIRALAVLAVAAIVYPLVVPTVHVVRARLARLVLTKPGVAAFDKAKPQAGEPNDSQTGLAALTTAAKRSPNQTGVYSIEWSPTNTSGAGVIAFLLPNDSTASTVLSQIRAQQLAAGSYASNSLTRTSTYAVAGVPGSYAGIYRPPAKEAGTAGSLAVTVFRYGHLVALSEAATVGSSPETAANTITAGEYAHLRSLGPGFSLSVTRYPVVATTLWGVGAVVLAAMFGLLPIARRRRRARRQRAIEEEMANRVVVGKQVIVKHHR